MSIDKRIVYFDIETSPNEVLSWRIGRNLTLTMDNIIKERQIICACWKYKGDPTVYSVDWGRAMSDVKVVKKLIKVIGESEVAIAHNGDGFDLKWLKGRAMMLHLPPISNISSIDTYKLSANNFNLNCHKLDYLSKIATGKGKLHTEYQLWKDVIKGKQRALKRMVTYCKRDVVLLEKVYEYILPYVDNLPVHFGIIEGGDKFACPKCGTYDFIKYGKYHTAANSYQKYRCAGGHVFRSRTCIKRAK